MSRKIDLPNIDDIINRYRSGETVDNMASELGVSRNTIYRAISRSGMTYPSGRFARVRPGINEILALYNSGIGASGVASRLGTGRTYIIRTLEQNGIELRNHREQQIERIKYSTKEQRLAWSHASHIAATGRKKTEKEIEQAAKTRFERGVCSSSRYEDELAFLFLERGISFVQQFPVGRYNCDFVIQSVAVEVFGGSWHRHGRHLARFENRTKKLFESGFDVILVFVNKRNPIDSTIADKIISEIEILSADKSSVRKYRVIWGSADLLSGGSSNDEHISMVFPLTHRRNPTTGRYESIPR